MNFVENVKTNNLVIDLTVLIQVIQSFEPFKVELRGYIQLLTLH